MKRDWFDWASLVFNTLATSAGLVGLFLAVKAYRVGIKAYEVSAESYRVAKEQGRKTFELEILRELTSLLDEALDMVAGEKTVRLPPIKAAAASRVWLLPSEEMEVWLRFLMVIAGEEQQDYLLSHPRVQEKLRSTDLEDNRGVRGILFTVLYLELHEAMRRRWE
ncbi:hypothetical protein [Micromonospora sp. NPDC005206]|uniref:hypothetical protein n=1 Tax=Micromonospora sp. NPDC005206 TaxID=3157022 RepID=UPI0033B8AAA7